MDISAVKLRNSYNIKYIDLNSIFIKPNSECIVETEHGLDIGKIIKIPVTVKKSNVEITGKLIRKMTDDDKGAVPEIESVEAKAFKLCREKAHAKNLKMKLITVKCLFDKSKIIFYFIAENRIDFRELVRELASVFRTRIEMRQVGVRDEARLVGGYGPCGKEHCCVHQRDEFEPVSIKMAKEQGLNLNSLKISGMCGRLLCCLGYEYETYKKLNKNLPRYGTEIMVKEDSYTVISSDTLSETLRIRSGDSILKISKYDIYFNKGKYSIKKELVEKILNKDNIEKEEVEDDSEFNFDLI